MNDDSAEWMAQLKASGQLRPVSPEGIGGDEGERQAHPQGQRVEAVLQGLGVAGGAVTDEGQQVLGTCSPERIAPILAGYRRTIEKAWSAATADPDHAGADGSPVGQCGVTSAWLQHRLLEDHGVLTAYCDGIAYWGSDWTPHVWLAGLDGSIFDLTADQFPAPVAAYLPRRTLMPTEVLAEPLRDRLALLLEAL